MTTKLFEIRDRGTLVPALAIQVSGADGYLLRRAGFDGSMIYLIALATQQCAYDPWGWGNRTMNNAHQYIVSTWDTLQSGDVVDVEFIRGETAAPKASESMRESVAQSGTD
jgi:hypothetical protein